MNFEGGMGFRLVESEDLVGAGKSNNHFMLTNQIFLVQVYFSFCKNFF
jgi:hypothetical protein